MFMNPSAIVAIGQLLFWLPYANSLQYQNKTLTTIFWLQPAGVTTLWLSFCSDIYIYLNFMSGGVPLKCPIWLNVRLNFPRCFYLLVNYCRASCHDCLSYLL